MFKRRRSRVKKPTDIELKTYHALDLLKVKFKREQYHGNYPVDFYLPDYNFSIQVDGSYWHSGCNKCRGDVKLTTKQKFQSNRDKACITYHKYCKISIIRICSCTIQENTIEDLANYIGKFLKRIKEGEKIYELRD